MCRAVQVGPGQWSAWAIWLGPASGTGILRREDRHHTGDVVVGKRRLAGTDRMDLPGRRREPGFADRRRDQEGGGSPPGQPRDRDEAAPLLPMWSGIREGERTFKGKTRTMDLRAEVARA